MRKYAIVSIVVAQLIVLAWMAGEREWVVRTGREVYLRTAPVDPRDPMRGDFVRLDYEMASVPKALCRDGVLEWFETKVESHRSTVRDQRVYAEIRLDPEGVAELISLSDRKPDEGLFLRGRATQVYPSEIEVRFGIEAFFMQQGNAQAFEDTVRNEKAGVPLNMAVAVSNSGLAVLRGYRWEPLGITVTVEQPPPTAPEAARRERRGIRRLTVDLKNHGTTPQAIIDGPAHQSLRLMPARARWRGGDQAAWLWVGEATAPAQLRAEQIKLLLPGESHQWKVDLTDAEWLVRKMDGNNAPGPATSIEALADDWTAFFRFEYRPPTAADSVGLPHAELIRHTRLRSRGFGAAGAID